MELIPLDPFQEVSPQNWKKACSMRGYFAKLEEDQKSATGQPDLSSSFAPLVSKRSYPHDEENDQSNSEPPKKAPRNHETSETEEMDLG